MKCLSVILLLVAATTAAPFSDHELGMWESFKVEHSKTYESKEEELFRMKVFIEKLHNIAEHNQLYEQGLVSFSLRLNRFSDMTHEEISATMKGVKLNDNLVNCKQPIDLKDAYNNIQAPTQVDWREKGAVTEVKDQSLRNTSKCGSCWAFSTTGSLEGRNFIKNGVLVSLSEQNLVDCSKSNFNHGCHGGNPQNAFEYINQNNGIDTEESYPYEAIDSTPCRYKLESKGAGVENYVCLPARDEEALMNEVARGPVSVLIDSNHTTFHSYGNDIYYEPECSSEKLDHAVTLVGYGTENGKDYWLLKNSWGTTWGLSGYMKLARNRNNHCGIATLATYPIAE